MGGTFCPAWQGKPTKSLHTSTCNLAIISVFTHYRLLIKTTSYLFPGPPGFPQVTLSRFGKQPIIVMVTHLNVFIVLITAVYAAEIRRDRHGLKAQDLDYWIMKLTQKLSKVHKDKTWHPCAMSLLSAFCCCSVCKLVLLLLVSTETPEALALSMALHV